MVVEGVVTGCLRRRIIKMIRPTTNTITATPPTTPPTIAPMFTLLVPGTEVLVALAVALVVPVAVVADVALVA